MAQAEQAIRSTRRTLDALARGESASASPAVQAGAGMTGASGQADLRDGEEEDTPG
jgi:hypothetical protein